MKKLRKTVVAGGVVYPAGTPATAELEQRVRNPKHWTGESDAPAPAPEAPPAPRGESNTYADWSKVELEDEATSRGLAVGGRGNKPDLIAALVADDGG